MRGPEPRRTAPRASQPPSGWEVLHFVLLCLAWLAAYWLALVVGVLELWRAL